MLTPTELEELESLVQFRAIGYLTSCGTQSPPPFSYAAKRAISYAHQWLGGCERGCGTRRADYLVTVKEDDNGLPVVSVNYANAVLRLGQIHAD